MKAFYAYPSSPPELDLSISQACKDLSDISSLKITTWREMNVAGRFIDHEVTRQIQNCDVLIADITRLNFNVSFEIGYAIGMGRKIILTLNEGVTSDKNIISDIGIFDTIGYETYSNAINLRKLIIDNIDKEGIILTKSDIDQSKPIYVIKPPYENDLVITMLSSLSRFKLDYRSYDKSENPRFSTLTAYNNISKSIANFIWLANSNATDSFNTNIRGAFASGLSMGLGRDTHILQYGDYPVPIDYRELVTICNNQDDVERFVNSVAPDVFRIYFRSSEDSSSSPKLRLDKLDFGEPAAENESDQLGNYFLETDQFKRVLKGSATIVVGRKGSGKTAIFYRTRDKHRQNRNNLVVDLKPEGHQLSRAKDLVLSKLSSSVLEHLMSALWEYTILVEMASRILNVDKKYYLTNHRITENYIHLQSIFDDNISKDAGDFSERLMVFINHIIDTYIDEDYSSDKVLSNDEITNIVYTHDLPDLRDTIIDYLHAKNEVHVIFDNIDKGWPPQGISETDITILKGLMDAMLNIRTSLSKNGIKSSAVVFVRDDVYETLVENTIDRGKDKKVKVDWHDRDLLKEMLRMRIQIGGFSSKEDAIEKAWSQICDPVYKSELSLDFVIDVSLMRPRNIIMFMNYARSYALNLKHDKIKSEDIDKAYSEYSAEVLANLNFEIRDVKGLDAEDIMHKFIYCDSKVSIYYIREILGSYFDDLIDVLIWFGFLGVKSHEKGYIYIYDSNYNFKKLKAISKDFSTSTLVEINRAFWPALDITASD